MLALKSGYLEQQQSARISFSSFQNILRYLYLTGLGVCTNEDRIIFGVFDTLPPCAKVLVTYRNHLDLLQRFLGTYYPTFQGQTSYVHAPKDLFAYV